MCGVFIDSSDCSLWICNKTDMYSKSELSVYSVLICGGGTVCYGKVDKKGGLNGSLTVEAAYIVPILCFMVYALLTLLFHLYNSVIAYQAGYTATMRVAQSRWEDVRIQYDKTEEELESVIGTRLLCADLKRGIEVTSSQIVVEYELNSYLLKNLWEGTSGDKITYKIQDPTGWIRYVRAILDWKKEIEEDDEIDKS